MEKNVERISKVNSEDIAQIEEIEKSQFALRLPQDTFSNAFKDGTSIFIKLEVNNILVCYLLASVSFYENEIIEIATHPEHLRKGYAELLLNELERLSKGKEYIYLEVRKSNASAIRLYTKLGYEAYNARKNYYRDHEDAVLMRKKLSI